MAGIGVRLPDSRSFTVDRPTLAANAFCYISSHSNGNSSYSGAGRARVFREIDDDSNFYAPEHLQEIVTKFDRLSGLPPGGRGPHFPIDSEM
jgi:hypothetical protein